jgi:hypothetical protein
METLNNNLYSLQEDENIINSLRCAICLSLPRDACMCAYCENIYCKECIDQWIKYHNKCLFRCDGALSIIPVPRKIKQIISMMKYKCSKCSNMILFGEIQKHEQECQEDLKECLKGCGSLVPKNYMEVHSKHFCPLEKLECKTCGSVVERKMLKNEQAEKEKPEYYRILEQKELVINDLKEKLTQSESQCHILENPLSVSDQIKFINRIKVDLSHRENRSIFKFNFSEILSHNYGNLIKKILSIVFMAYVKHDGNDFLYLVISVGILLKYNMKTKERNLLQIHNESIICSKLIYINDKPFFVCSGFDLKLSKTNLQEFKITKCLNFTDPITCIAESDCLLVCGDTKGTVIYFIKDTLEELSRRKVCDAKIIFIEFDTIRNKSICITENKFIMLLSIEGEVESKVKMQVTLQSATFCNKNNTFYLISAEGNIYSLSLINNIKVVQLTTLNPLEGKYKIQYLEIEGFPILYCYGLLVSTKFFFIDCLKNLDDNTSLILLNQSASPGLNYSNLVETETDLYNIEEIVIEQNIHQTNKYKYILQSYKDGLVSMFRIN